MAFSIADEKSDISRSTENVAIHGALLVVVMWNVTSVGDGAFVHVRQE
jgi:hypothetical protein